MFKKLTIIVCISFIHFIAFSQHAVSNYDIKWEKPSINETGNMPIGNGSLGSNVWVEKNGDLLLYLSRNDSHSELQRLLKLGRLRISFSGNPFGDNKPFLQVLHVNDGSIKIEAGNPGEKISLRIFVHANSPILYIHGNSEKSVSVNVTLENWRRNQHQLDSQELVSTWVYRKGVPNKNIDTWESADTILSQKNAISWYHRNAYSCIPVHIREQGMSDYSHLVNDPLVNNTFGGYVSAKGLVNASDTVLQTKKAIKKIDIKIVGYTAQAPTSSAWITAIKKISNNAVNSEKAYRQTKSWWNGFWNRSWVYMGGPTASSGNDSLSRSLAHYTQIYILSKYQLACQMRNKFPARFQGGIFNVDPKYAYHSTDVRDKNYSADYRFYGVNYWWQNVRFLYQPQYAQGNFDLMQPYFNFYLNQIPIFEARGKKYYNVSGIYMQECITTFGLPGMSDFGFGNKEYGEIYTRNIWQQCLEMTVLLLDYYHYTGDEKFLLEKALPWARKALLFYQTKFKKDKSGRLHIFPTHALETYWTDVENDMPSIAGLHYVLSELLKLPTTFTTVDDRTDWMQMKSILPPLPKKKDSDGTWIVDNAEVYNPKRTNFEAPDLYCVFPFRIYGFNKPNKSEVEKAFFKMPNPGRVCWYQTGIFSARLGLAKEAAKDIRARSNATLKGFRFPGYMNSPHDWKPDYDGVGNMMNTLQEMLMHCEGDSIYLFPAWPKQWDVTFKLHAFKNTTVEVEYKNGQVKDLKVFPESRRKDVILMASE